MGKADVEIRADAGRKREGKLELVRLLSNNSLARRQLKWRPSYTLEAGLKKTIAWFEKHRNDYGEPYYAEYS